MNWDLTDEQEASAGLAGQILGDKLSHGRLKEIEAAGGWAEAEWQALVDAGLVGLALPERYGGAGFGVLEAALVLEQIGRTVAPVPYLASVAYGALPLSRLAPPELAERWVPAAAAGDAVLSGAPGAPRVTATATGPGWRLDGTSAFVPFGAQTDRVLLPVATDQGPAIVLVDPRAEGVVVEVLRNTAGLPEVRLCIAGAEVDAAEVLAGPGQGGSDAIDEWTRLATVGVCAVAAGVTARAVELTGTYTSERHQFDSPIATFQAVAHRAADAYIDATAVRFTMLHAAWRLDAELPAADEVDVAKYWAAEGGQRVVHGAQHLHGGIGVDRDYPLHRYFLWAKVLELSLGGATERLVALGRRLAAST